MSNIGKVFVDLSDKTFPVYAVGETGFIHLANLGTGESSGHFIPYDSAFPGPEFFDNIAFLQCNVTW